MRIRFSLLTFLLCVALVGVYLAGYRSGQDRGMQVMHELGTQIEVLATIQLSNNSSLDSKRLVQRSFVTNEGESYRIGGAKLKDLFVDIIPTRVAPTATVSSKNLKQTTIELKNISVAELEMQVSESVPHLIDSELVAFDRATNAITFNDDSPELFDNLEALARFSDKRPLIYQAKLRIGRTMADGSQVILYEPTIVTLKNLAGKIRLTDLNETISVDLRFDDVPLTRHETD